jgi:hypothetical protein
VLLLRLFSLLSLLASRGTFLLVTSLVTYDGLATTVTPSGTRFSLSFALVVLLVVGLVKSLDGFVALLRSLECSGVDVTAFGLAVLFSVVGIESSFFRRVVVRFVGSKEEVFWDFVSRFFFWVGQDFPFRDEVEDLTQRGIANEVEHGDDYRR